MVCGLRKRKVDIVTSRLPLNAVLPDIHYRETRDKRLRIPRVIVGLASAVILFGCSKPSQEGATVPTEQTIRSGSVTDGNERASLEGGWRVVTIDGTAPTEPIPLIGTSDLLYWPPGCADQSIRWHSTPDGFAFPPTPDSGPRDVCSIGYPQELRTVFARLASMQRMSTTSGGAYRFQGPEGSLVMRPATLALDGQELPSTILGDFRVSHIDGEPVSPGQTIIVSIDEKRLTFGPECAGFTWTYEKSGAYLSTRRPTNPHDQAPGKPPPPVCTVSVSPQQRALAIALDHVERVGLTDTGEITLTGGSHSATLVVS